MSRSIGQADRRRGAAALEFAVCAPVLLTFVFGIIEFSRAAQLQQSVRQSAFEGARAAVALDADASDAIAAAKANLAAIGITDATVTVTPSPLFYYTPTITVTVSARPATSGWLLKFFNRSSTISGSITLIREVQSISAPGTGVQGALPAPVWSGSGSNNDVSGDGSSNDGSSKSNQSDGRESDGRGSDGRRSDGRGSDGSESSSPSSRDE